MKEAIVTIGVSASGKSTWASEFLKENPNWVECNRDMMRVKVWNQLTGRAFNWKEWKWNNEHAVTDMIDRLLTECFNNSVSIICTDTNLNEKFRAQLVETLQSNGYNIHYKIFSISVEEAIRRDATRGDMAVGESVIRKQMIQFEALDKSKLNGIMNPS